MIFTTDPEVLEMERLVAEIIEEMRNDFINALIQIYPGLAAVPRSEFDPLIEAWCGR